VLDARLEARVVVPRELHLGARRHAKRLDEPRDPLRHVGAHVVVVNAAGRRARYGLSRPPRPTAYVRDVAERGDGWEHRSVDETRGLARRVPIVGWLPRYRREWLAGDVVAGIAVTALVVPKNLGYAGIAGIPLENGLYAAAAGALIYALFC